MNIKKKFVESLKALMINVINVEDLAEQLKISDTALYRYLSEDRLPTLKIAILIADYFRCSLDYLFGRKQIDNANIIYKTCLPTGTNIKVLMKKYGFTEYRLAKETKISRAAFFRWSNNKTVPTMESLIKVAKALDCTLDELVGRE